MELSLIECEKVEQGVCGAATHPLLDFLTFYLPHNRHHRRLLISGHLFLEDGTEGLYELWDVIPVVVSLQTAGSAILQIIDFLIYQGKIGLVPCDGVDIAEQHWIVGRRHLISLAP